MRSPIPLIIAAASTGMLILLVVGTVAAWPYLTAAANWMLAPAPLDPCARALIPQGKIGLRAAMGITGGQP